MRLLHRIPSPATLVAEAERVGRAEDGMGEAAAMVYVGDVYGLQYADRLGRSDPGHMREAIAHRVWPFLR